MSDWKLSNEPTKYPLWCVDRGLDVDPEHQYLGPFSTHIQASEKMQGGETIRCCRRLLPSEVDFEFEALKYLRTIWLIAEKLDELATSGDLPECAWSPIGEQIVFVKSFTRELPTEANYKEWVDRHLTINAHICEGDE